MTNQLVALIANIALTLSVIVAVIFGIAQVISAGKDRRERLTMETLRHFHSREFAEILHFVSTTTFPEDHDRWLEWPDANQVKFIQLAQEMESLGMLLGEKLIDIELVDKTLGSFVYTTWEKYKPVITDLRVKNDDPFLAEYFQWMAEQIDKRMKLKPRKPFFVAD